MNSLAYEKSETFLEELDARLASANKSDKDLTLGLKKSITIPRNVPH